MIKELKMRRRSLPLDIAYNSRLQFTKFTMFKFWIMELLAEPLVEKIQNPKFNASLRAGEFKRENNSIIQNLKLIDK